MLRALCHMITRQDGHGGQSYLAKLRDDIAGQAAIGTKVGIGISVGAAAGNPGSTRRGCWARVTQAGNQEAGKKGRQVLSEVGMSALGEVEFVGLGVLLGLLLSSIRYRIFDAAGLARDGDQGLVVGVDEYGRGCDSQNVTVVVRISFCARKESRPLCGIL
jgi:hypothetical protein